jgi:endonuclease/exonuclease/phosphatase family metal-dependent hydrolase
VATYNIRVDIPFDTANNWDKRKETLTELLDYYKPDIFGTQEGLVHQLNYIRERLKTYEYAGGGRSDGKTAGEFTCIFYNAQKYELITDSTFWLSETPDRPSKGWDAAYLRICTYALLRYRPTGYKIWVVNTHLDNTGPQARLKGAELVIARIKQVSADTGYPIILMGDLNSTENDGPVQYINTFLTDCRVLSKSKPYGPSGTFNDFEVNRQPERRIDFIFTTPANVMVNKYAVIDDRSGLKYPSDHLPVMVELEIH